MKTSELSGAALDWAVAKCEAVTTTVWDGVVIDEYSNPLTYHDDWALAGPIIERERICISSRENKHWKDKKFWDAYIYRWGVHMGKTEEFICRFDANTPLVAAMRCYVASKMGDEVEIPEGL